MNKKEVKSIFPHPAFLQNRRGQELSTTTIILLILGLVILVVLIVGFSTGWTAFKKIILPTNVDTVVEECTSTCSLGNKFSFCSGERTLRVNEDKLDVKTSCAVFEGASSFDKYNIEDCPAIKCDLKCEEIIIDAKAGRKDLASGKYDVSELANDLGQGQKCIIN